MYYLNRSCTLLKIGADKELFMESTTGLSILRQKEHWLKPRILGTILDPC